MNTRDSRAILVLVAWGICLSGYLGYSRITSIREKRRLEQARLDFLLASTWRLEAQRAQDRNMREQVELAFPNAWHLESPDHLRLKGEEGLLSAMDSAGLKNTRLEPKGTMNAYGIRQFVWTLEGEGTLSQWAHAIHAAEDSQPFISITGFELALTGDPWRPEEGNQEGPILKGKVDCSWIVGP